MTTPEDLEDRYLQLSGQHTDRIEQLKKLCELHGVSEIEVLSLLSPIEPSLRTSPELAARLHDDRNSKLDVLPTDLRAAVVQWNELNELVCEAKGRLAQKLCCDGHSVHDIAERLGETEEAVVALLQSAGDV